MTGPDDPTLDTIVLALGDTATVRLRGVLDLATAGALRAALQRATADRPARLVVDVAHVEFMDPAGARPLLDLARPGSPAQGSAVPRLVIRGASPFLARVLELLGLGTAVDS